MAYAQIEPFGEEWSQTGVLAALVANVAGGRGEGLPPFEPSDFMPRTKEAAQNETEMLRRDVQELRKNARRI